MKNLSWTKVIFYSVMVTISAYVGLTALRSIAGSEMDETLHKGIYNPKPPTNPLYSGIIRITNFKSSCSAVVIDDNYALTAAHCVTGTMGGMLKDDYAVIDENYRYTGVYSNAMAIDNSTDLAILVGDFRQFSRFKVDFEGKSIKKIKDMTTVACGYPLTGSLFCSETKLTGNFLFRLTAKEGIGLPGSSGGPVFNDNLEVIGVMSAVTPMGLLYAPVLGADASFSIKRIY